MVASLIGQCTQRSLASLWPPPAAQALEIQPLDETTAFAAELGPARNVTATAERRRLVRALGCLPLAEARREIAPGVKLPGGAELTLRAHSLGVGGVGERAPSTLRCEQAPVAALRELPRGPACVRRGDMLRRIRLRNFRSLRDTGDIELRPIVLLTGANSSGKSSFLRFFPLVRQTVEKPSNSPLLWYRRDGYVDFGDFTSTLSRGSAEDTIEVCATFEMPEANSVESTALYEVTNTIALKHGHSHVRRTSISLWDDTITVHFEPDRPQATLVLNDQRLLELPIDPTFGQFFAEFPGDAVIKLALGFLEAQRPAALSAVSMDDLEFWSSKYIEHGPSEAIHTQMLLSLGELTDETRIDDTFLDDERVLETFRRYAFLRDFSGHIDGLEQTWEEFGLGVRYIGPFRSAPERFYRKEEIPVDEITVNGENLAMFLHSLAESERQGFSNWVREYFGFGVSTHTDGAHVVLKIEPPSDSHFDFNLVDMGFGISQLLPVVAQCWIARQSAQNRTTPRKGPPPSLLAIEQPELHLHPHHQYQLAEMFAGLAGATQAVGHRMPMIIETHSEAMLHRFGELVEAGKLSPDDILVLFFEKLPGKDVTTVRQANFNAEGVLENWPIGFFRM